MLLFNSRKAEKGGGFYRMGDSVCGFGGGVGACSVEEGEGVWVEGFFESEELSCLWFSSFPFYREAINRCGKGTVNEGSEVVSENKWNGGKGDECVWMVTGSGEVKD